MCSLVQSGLADEDDSDVSACLSLMQFEKIFFCYTIENLQILLVQFNSKHGTVFLD